MGFLDNLKDAFAAGGDREGFNARRDARLAGELVTKLQLGQIAVRNTQPIEPPRWSKYDGKSRGDSEGQTNYYEGFVGERNQTLKIHIVVDKHGKLQYIRDIDGTVLFDRSRGHTPPPGWD